jgi:hypothetical protein
MRCREENDLAKNGGVAQIGDVVIERSEGWDSFSSVLDKYPATSVLRQLLIQIRHKNILMDLDSASKNHEITDLLVPDTSLGPSFNKIFDLYSRAPTSKNRRSDLSFWWNICFESLGSS